MPVSRVALAALALVVCAGAWMHTGRPGALASTAACATWLVQSHLGAAPGVLAVVATAVALRPRFALTKAAAAVLAAALEIPARRSRNQNTTSSRSATRSPGAPTGLPSGPRMAQSGCFAPAAASQMPE